MSDGWRFGAVVCEALANLRASGVRGALVALGLGGMLGGLVWAELATTSDVKTELQRFEAAGGRVIVVDGPDGLDAARCEELRQRSWVVAAGGWRRAGQVVAINAPRVFFDRWEVTGDIVRLWDPGFTQPAERGLVVGRAVAAELGLRDGSWLWLGDGTGARVAVADPAGRNHFAGRVVFDRVPPTGRLAQCWVEVTGEAFSAALSTLRAHFAPDEAEARPAVVRGQFASDPAGILAARPQRWAWVLVGCVGAAIVGLVALFRRSEAAIYRAFGLPRLGLLLMHQVETSVLTSGALVVGALWGTAVHALGNGLPGWDEVSVALRTATMGAAAVVIAAPLLAWLAGTGSPAVLLKER